MLEQLSQSEFSSALVEFDAKTLTRARSYATPSRIELLEVPEFSDEDIVAEAIVTGSHPYHTTLIWDEGRLMGECTCPVVHDCKHAAALAMLVYSSPQSSSRRRARDVRAAQRVGDWLGGVASRADTARREQSELLVAYTLILPNGYGRPYVQVGRTQPGKTGRLRKPEKLGSIGGLAGLELAPWVPEDDERLITELVALSQRRYPGQLLCELQQLSGPFLERLAATERFFIKDHRRGPARYGPPRSVRLQLLRSDDDQYSLAPSADRATLIQARTWHYIADDGPVLGAVDFGVTNDVVRRLLDGPPLPAATLPTVRRSLREVLGYEVEFRPGDEPAKKTRARPAAPPLVPILNVSTRPITRDWTQLEILPVAGYGDERFAADAPFSPNAVARDLVAEEALWNQFRSASGLDHHGGVYEDTEAARESLRDLVAVLRGRGWSIEGNVDLSPVEAEFVERLAESDDAGGVWFSYELGVVVDGETTPLLPLLLQALRAGDLDLRSLEQGVTVALPDGRRVHVPGDQLARWVRPLIELQLRGLDGDGALKLPASTLLDSDDDGGARPFGDAAALARVRERVAQLIDLEPRPGGDGFRGELRRYQGVGHAWLRRLHDDALGGMLADDMGLGKTVQLLAFIDGLRASRTLSAKNRALVVAPRSVVDNWAHEAERFAPKLRVGVHLGPERPRALAGLGKTTLVLTSYQTLQRDIDWLAEHSWATVVLDEAQAVKTPGTKVRRAVKRLEANSRFCVTGTPIENNLMELWSQVDIAMPGLLGSRKAFGSTFRTPIEKQDDRERLDLLRRRIRPFLLRRRKADVDIELPDKTEVVERVDLSGGQRDLYESLRLVFDKNVRDALNARGKGRSSMVILDALLRLRQSCCDPRIVNLPQAKKVRDSAKLDRLGEILEDLRAEGRRTLVFSQFTSMLSLIEAECERRGIAYVKLTGRTRDRARVIREFQQGDVPVFLISLKAGGTGLNLTAADTVIHYDPWWNPAVQAQATDRAHRIGQTKPVIVYRLVAAGTVEDRILEMQKVKQDLSDATLEKGGLSHFSADDVEALLAPIG